MEDAERRRHPRLRLDGSMVGRATIMADFRIVALSETGAALETEVPMALGSVCDLTLGLPHGSVDLKGRVVFVQAEREPGAPWEVGVDFERVDEMDSALLQAFLDRERRREM